MAKDLEMCSDISPDTGGSVADTGSDFGGDLAKDDGVDLNAGECAKAEGLAKATMMSYDVPPPPPPVPAEIREIDASQVPGYKTPEQIVAEMKEAWEYNEPATDNRDIETRQPLEPEYGEHPE